MEIAVLGPLRVDGQSLSSAKERAIVELLALRAPRSVTVADLVGALWGTEPPSSAVRTLQSLMSRLRGRVPGLGITRDGDTYRAAIDVEDVDAHRFERLLAAGKRAAAAGDDDAAVDALRSARDLWRSAPAADLVGGDATPEVARLEELHRCVVEELAEARLAVGDHAVLIAELEANVASEPLRERRWGQLMIAFARDGRRADALRTFQDLRCMLADELGLEPSAELIALDRAIATDELASPSRRESSDIPTWFTNLVGRDDDERVVTKRVDEHRLVTVTGPGGVGKTRIACRVAEALAPNFADGARFVDLTPVRDPSRVALAVAGALGVRDLPGTGIVDTLVSGCSRLDALVVVDNCEHVVGEVATLVARLLRASPMLRVLATSREQLGIDGEAVVPLPPLAVPDDGGSDIVQLGLTDSVLLFVARAVDVVPGFVLDAGNASTVASLCRHLDGLPLAIELAAAQTDVLTLAELESTLVAHPGAIRNRERGAVERHRSLETVVDWSVDLLDTEHRAVLEAMSVFPGSASLDAIDAVAGDATSSPDEVLSTVAGLVRRSLVVAEAATRETRYHLLETVRQRTLARMTERDVEALQARMFSWIQGWSERAADGLLGDEQSAWLDRVAAEQDNLDAALAWGISRPEHALEALHVVRGLFTHWFARGTRRMDGVRWLSSAVAAATRADAADRADALTQGVVMLAWNDLAAATELAARARDVSTRAPHDVTARGYADLAAALVEVFRGDARARTSAASARDKLDGFARALAENRLAMSLEGVDRYEALVANARRFLELGDEHLYGGILGGSVDMGVAVGVDDAVLRGHSEEAVAIAREVACASCEALVLGGMALLERLDDPERALMTAQRTLALADSINETYGVIVALDLIVGLMSMNGRADDTFILDGAVGALRARTGYRLVLPGRGACRESGLAAAAARLSSSGQEALRVHGRSLPHEDVVRLALS